MHIAGVNEEGRIEAPGRDATGTENAEKAVADAGKRAKDIAERAKRRAGELERKAERKAEAAGRKAVAAMRRHPKAGAVAVAGAAFGLASLVGAAQVAIALASGYAAYRWLGGKPPIVGRTHWSGTAPPA